MKKPSPLDPLYHLDDHELAVALAKAGYGYEGPIFVDPWLVYPSPLDGPKLRSLSEGRSPFAGASLAEYPRIAADRRLGKKTVHSKTPAKERAKHA